ncbi:MAG: L-fucose/L-arabinose isomerase family protein [Thermoproteota archaeon]
MKNTKIGLTMLLDERKHVYPNYYDKCYEVIESWSRFIKDSVKFADGEAPETVVSSELISSINSARRVGEEFLSKGVRQVILVYNVWDFPYLVWPFVNTLGKDKPMLSLSNNEGKYPGNVGLLATDGALRQAGLRTHRIVGDPEDPEVKEKVKKWIMAAIAATNIRNEVYGMYGGHSMGMETGYFHLVPIQRYFGTTVGQVDQLLLVERMKEIDEQEVEKGLRWMEDMLGENIKYDGKMLTRETLGKQIRMYLAVKKINEEMGFDFCGIKGQRELSEHVVIPDVAEMLLNDPYDWNGLKEPTVCATEADSFAALTMQVLKYVSGGLPVLFMDVRLYHPELNIWDFCNSGNHASWYASRSFNPKDNLKKVILHPALELYFKAGGASVSFDAGPGELTFARLGLFNDKIYMIIVNGESIELDEGTRKRINAETDPTWPHVHARLNCSHEEFAELFPANHIHAVAGNRIQELKYFCEITGVTPIILGEGEHRKPIWSLLE